VTYPLCCGVAAAHAVEIGKWEEAGFAGAKAAVSRFVALGGVGIIGSGFEALDFDSSGFDGRGLRKGRSQGKDNEEGRQLHLGVLILCDMMIVEVEGSKYVEMRRKRHAFIGE
jgi:hypothetical protein